MRVVVDGLRGENQIVAGDAAWQGTGIATLIQRPIIVRIIISAVLITITLVIMLRAVTTSDERALFKTPSAMPHGILMVEPFPASTNGWVTAIFVTFQPDAFLHSDSCELIPDARLLIDSTMLEQSDYSIVSGRDSCILEADNSLWCRASGDRDVDELQQVVGCPFTEEAKAWLIPTLTSGQHVAQIEVTDASGKVTTYRWAFKVKNQPGSVRGE
jgi:hypothetical protein